MKYLIYFLITFLLFIPQTIYGGVDFDGDEALNCGNDANYPTDFPFTVSVWFKVDGTNHTQNVWSWSDLSSSTVYLSMRIQNSPLDCTFQIRDGGATDTTSSDALPDGIVLCTYKSNADNDEIYVNGVSQRTSTSTFPSSSAVDQQAIGSLCRSGVCTTDNFTGEIYEVAFWDVELTDAEIAQLYNGGMYGMPLQIRPNNLLSYWNLGDVKAGVSAEGFVFQNRANPGTGDCTGDDGANNTGLTGADNSGLSYP